ncbi:ABC-type spermidine/putrescine transport system, permease component II [Rubellimicrobium thermophilum DSM 16684]|uniref:ABC-type spermidine/putrescine transport system, permease component II n=1 Tax=Rubellimicrobium thermophilum DSM 16684 TaxID=1123069 RepID=S9SIN4_9RHOB|nr:ABC transporter permease [Rubellimicrobium thermophilum]EPX86214.1 ABC-type spermidine/putrescine transport system, permease component II [Rubellimicrobium thermophilum DSM 16684]
MRGWPLRIYVILMLAFLYAPILLLPIFAFNDAAIIAFPLAGFSTRWFEQLWSTPALHQALRNSLVIATVTALLATTLGVCAARAGAMASFPGKRAMLGFVMLPLVLPEIIVAVALLIVVRQVLDLDLSNWTVIAAHTVICMPFSIAILNGAFQNLDPSYEEAAMDLGEGRWGAFRLVTLPLVMPGIVSSLLICFIISLDDFVLAQFLTGQNPTLPVYIYGLTRFVDALPVIMALGTILVTLSITLLIIAEWFRRRGLARAGIKDSGGFL